MEVPRKSYSTQVVTLDDKDMDKEPKLEDGDFIKPHIFTFTIPEVPFKCSFCPWLMF